MRTSKANPKLVFIYGPPGVGKLTVAKELAKLTGFKLFHNHLTIEPVKALFEFGTPQFSHHVHKIRFQLFRAALENKINIIFTMVYFLETDDKIMKKIIKLAEKHGGKILLVLLTCSKKELFKRLKNPSRKGMSKIKSIKLLKGIMEKYELSKPLKLSRTLVIDNTNLSPKKTAEKIVKHYKLA